MIIKVGMKYKVKLDDCCVAGHFTATITRIMTRDEQDKQVEVKEIDLNWDTDEVHFNNGVVLTQLGGVECEEIQ